MTGIEVGSVCIKTHGRQAGKKVTVTSIEKNGFVTIEAEKMKKKKCNPRHLFIVGKEKK